MLDRTKIVRIDLWAQLAARWEWEGLRHTVLKKPPTHWIYMLWMQRSAVKACFLGLDLNQLQESEENTFFLVNITLAVYSISSQKGEKVLLVKGLLNISSCTWRLSGVKITGIAAGASSEVWEKESPLINEIIVEDGIPLMWNWNKIGYNPRVLMRCNQITIPGRNESIQNKTILINLAVVCIVLWQNCSDKITWSAVEICPPKERGWLANHSTNYMWRGKRIERKI